MIGRITWPVAATVSLIGHAILLLGVSSVLARGTPSPQTTIELSADMPAIARGEVAAVSASDAAPADGDVLAPVDESSESVEAVPVADGVETASAVTESAEAVTDDIETASADGSQAAVAAPAPADEAQAVDAATDVAPIVSSGTDVTQADSNPADAVTEADVATRQQVSDAAEAGATDRADAALDSETAAGPAEDGSAAVVAAGSGDVVEAPSDSAQPATDGGVVPLAPQTQIAAVDTSATEPSGTDRVASPEGGNGVAAPVVETDPATAAPVTGDQQATLIPAPRPPEPAAPVDRRAAIASFLQQKGTGDCFLAVPRDVQRDAAHIAGFAPQPDDLSQFERQFVSATSAALTLDRRVISKEQCVALELVGALSQQDGNRLSLQLESTDIGDGDELVAEIQDDSLPFLNLLLVDDDGMAVDVTGFVQRAENRAVFRAPMHLQANGRGRTQLLIAVSSEKELGLLIFQDQRPAAQVFPLAIGEARMRKLKTDVAIAAFKVN